MVLWKSLVSIRAGPSGEGGSRSGTERQGEERAGSERGPSLHTLMRWHRDTVQRERVSERLRSRKPPEKRTRQETAGKGGDRQAGL